VTRCWTVFAFEVECTGAEGRHVIPAGEPVRVIGAAIRRCQAHSTVPVDWQEVDQARLDLEVAQREQKPRVPGPVTRVAPPRKPVPLSQIADSLPFDPKAAAAGDEP
jgi:hypothetical protein